MLWRLFANWRARRAVAHLETLDDHLLRDIGLDRQDLRWASNLPLTVNPAMALEDRAARRMRLRR
jgi:hypothetical protein